MYRRPIRIKPVKRARGRQAFQLAAVEQLGIDPLGKIVEAFVRAIGLPLGDQCFHRLFADALERPERIADLAVFDARNRRVTH